MLNDITQLNHAGLFYPALKLIKQKKSKKNNTTTVLSILKSTLTCNFSVNEKDFNIKKYIDNFNYSQFGYENIDDIDITASADIFNGSTTITVIPKRVYQMTDEVELPPYYSEHSRKVHMLIIDLFERFKIMTQSFLDITAKQEQIKLYATKNLQILEKLLSDARTTVRLAITKNDHKLIRELIAFVTIIIQAILYSQKLFGRFIDGYKYTREELFGRIYKEVDINKIIEIYSVKKEVPLTNDCSNNSELSIKWNGQVNVLVTLFYDLMKFEVKDRTSILECRKEDIKTLLNNYFHDKNGNPINKSTIDTCLNEYREDKRPRENRRIILKCDKK